MECPHHSGKTEISMTGFESSLSVSPVSCIWVDNIFWSKLKPEGRHNKVRMGYDPSGLWRRNSSDFLFQEGAIAKMSCATYEMAS